MHIKGSISNTTSRLMEMGESEVKVFTVKEATDAMQGKGKIRFTIPKFQRGIVWNESKRKSLISSIQKGYPIGSILLFKESDERYRLIDGLQRCSSLDKYRKKPVEHMDMENLQTLSEYTDLKSKIEGFEPLVRDDSEDSEEEDELPGVDWLEKWIRSDGVVDFDHLEPTNLLTYLKSEFSSDDIITIFEESKALCDKIKEVYNIDDYKIPAVVYSGDTENLSDIFERINVQGTRLSQLQILAAQWSDSPVNFDQTDQLETKINDANQKRYNTLEDEGYDVDKIVDEDSMDLYEYLFGLGKVLAERSPGLLKSATDTDPDTIGFYLCGIWKKTPVGKLSKLENLIGQNSDLQNFSKAAVRATEKVDSWFKSIYSLRLNKKDGEIEYLHSENQITSIIGRVMLEIHDVNSMEESPLSPGSLEIMKKSCLGWYLLDIINQHWKGSGDSKMFRRCWNDGEDGGYVLNDLYTNLAAEDNAKAVIKSWYSEQYESKQKKRVSYTPAQKAVLKFMYKDIVTHNDNIETTFEIEHINSVSDMKNKIEKDSSDGWAMSILPNLMILPKEINKQKGKKSIKEYWSSISDSDKLKIKGYLISPVDKIPDTAKLDEASYYEYFSSRWNEHVFPKILESLGY